MTELANPASYDYVPASYAEKTMASLMQLHTELMDEKERRIDLFRKLMEREQSLAELKMYVKVLEEQLARPASASPVVEPSSPEVAQAPTPVAAASAQPPPRIDGWRTW